MKNTPINTIPSVSESDRLRLDWCIKTLENVKQLGRNNPLGDHYPEIIMVIDAIKRVLETNSINEVPNVCESDRLRLDSCLRTLEDMKQLGRSNLLGDHYPEVIMVIGAIKRVLQPNLVE